MERTNNKKCKGILPLGHGLPPHVCVICYYYGDACPNHGLGVTWEGEDEQEEEQEKEDPQKDGAEEALASSPSKRLKVE